MSIRPATEADLEAIVWISTATLLSDPAYRYQHPYTDLYPEDSLKDIRRQIEMLFPAGEKTIMVYESPSIEDPAVTKVVAFSLWIPPSLRFAKPPPPAAVQSSAENADATETAKQRSSSVWGTPQGRDFSPTRMAAFSAAVAAARPKMLDEKYGDAQFYLQALSCHPDYHRRGAGTVLSRWGIERARARGLNVTLSASPMGRLLYAKLGFEVAGTYRVQAEGEHEFLDMVYMVLELPKKLEDGAAA